MIEPTRVWHRSSFCSDAACVEATPVGEKIAVRDGKRRDAAHLLLDRQAWDDFLDGVSAGEFRAL